MISKLNNLNISLIINYGICTEERFLDRVECLSHDGIIITLLCDNEDKTKYKKIETKYLLDTYPLTHIFGL